MLAWCATVYEMEWPISMVSARLSLPEPPTTSAAQPATCTYRMMSQGMDGRPCYLLCAEHIAQQAAAQMDSAAVMNQSM